MLGLAIGSHYMNKKLKKKDVRSFISIEFAIVAYSVLLPFVLILLSRLRAGFVLSQAVFSVLTLIIAVMVGMEFPLASKLSFKKVSKTAARLYNSDLIGSALGALIASALLIPLLGIVKVCMLIALVNLSSAVIITVKRKNYISK
jgi:spermidine synthase